MTDYKALADEILNRFTPFAFKCECGGADADCASVRQDEAEQIRYYHLLRVVKFIESKGE